jgi:hypothetical protein
MGDPAKVLASPVNVKPALILVRLTTDLSVSPPIRSLGLARDFFESFGVFQPIHQDFWATLAPKCVSRVVAVRGHSKRRRLMLRS